MFKKRNKVINLILLSLIFIAIILSIIIYIQSNTSTKNFTASLPNTINKESSPSEDADTINKESSPSEDIDTINKDTNNLIDLTSDNMNIPVLYYHSVNIPESNDIIISPKKIKQQLEYVKSLGYNTLTIYEFSSYILEKKPIPKKSILITFDDGYMDNYTNLFPILKSLSMKATIFVIAGGIDDNYYLSSSQIKEMVDYGIDIQSHTISHAHLNSLSHENKINELKNSRIKIEKLTNKKVISVAYPFGEFDEDTINATKEAGYSIAFTTNRGYDDQNSNVFKLNRLYVSSSFTFDEFKDKLINS